MVIQSSRYKIITHPAKWMNNGAVAFCSAHINVSDAVPFGFVNQLKDYVSAGLITLHTSQLIPSGESK